MSKRLRKLLGEKETHLFLFAIGCVLFNWPFIDMFFRSDLMAALRNLLVLWGLVIVVLFFVSRSCNGSKEDESSRPQRDRS